MEDLLMLVQQPALKVDQTNVILSCHSLSRKIMYFGWYNEQLHSLKIHAANEISLFR